MSRYEKKVKSKLDDEIELAGLEALVPEELQKKWILNSNRLRTFEDARLKVVTYVETKFGLRIRDPRPGETVSRAQSDPVDVDEVNSLVTSKGKSWTAPCGGCFTCGAAHYQSQWIGTSALCKIPTNKRMWYLRHVAQKMKCLMDMCPPRKNRLKELYKMFRIYESPA